jgi:uncharacterized coiled-coil protein SlyX
MDSYREEENRNEGGKLYEPLRANPWLGLVIVVLLVIAGLGITYGYHEQNMVNQLKGQTAVANTSMSQLQTQVGTLTAKLNEMNAAQTAPASSTAATTAPANTGASHETAASTSEESMTPGAPAPAVPAGDKTAPAAVASAKAKPAHVKHSAAKRKAPVDNRYAQLKAQLDEEQKQLKATQDEVAKNRADLEGSISSTRDELSGSIAKTHEELVALEKRGERNYFEFDLTKSKDFQRIGPLTLSLRKADTKHKNYDLAMVVDDNELSKKKVNLYEPIWIHTETGGESVQVVVNKIGKNVVHGYVNAPKYKQSELAALGTSASVPASGTAQPVPAPQQ